MITDYIDLVSPRVTNLLLPLPGETKKPPGNTKFLQVIHKQKSTLLIISVATPIHNFSLFVLTATTKTTLAGFRLIFYKDYRGACFKYRPDMSKDSHNLYFALVFLYVFCTSLAITFNRNLYV